MKDIHKIKMNTLEDLNLNNPSTYNKIKTQGNFNNKTWFNNMFQSKQQKEVDRIKRLKPFGDADKDGIPNTIDKQPFHKNKTVWGFLK